MHYLKDTGSLWMTANFCGIHQCTVSKTIRAVCEAIKSVLWPKYLHLLRTTTEMRKKLSQSEVKFGMIQTFRCIGGTHISLKCPLVNSQDFFNYQQSFTLNFQTILIINATLWMWNVNDQVQSTTRKFLQIQPFVKTWERAIFNIHSTIFCRIMNQYRNT